MFCGNCGTQLEEGAKFCSSCGTPVQAAAATPPPPPPPPQSAAPPPSQVSAPPPPPPPQASAPAAPQAAGNVVAEKIVLMMKTGSAKPPGKRTWHYDIMITDRRVVISKAGALGILGKGLAAGGAVGIATDAVSIVGGLTMMSLGSVMSTARVPSLDDDRQVASTEVDGYATSKPDNFQAYFDQSSGVQMKKGGFFSDSKMTVQTPAGPLEFDIGGWFDELFPIMQQVLGPKVVSV